MIAADAIIVSTFIGISFECCVCVHFAELDLGLDLGTWSLESLLLAQILSVPLQVLRVGILPLSAFLGGFIVHLAFVLFLVNTVSWFLE